VIDRFVRAFGKESIATLRTRYNRACALWGQQADDRGVAPYRAETAFGELLVAQERTLGPDHPLTQRTRHNLRCVRDDIQLLRRRKE
jgi:hypothetical protein